MILATSVYSHVNNSNIRRGVRLAWESNTYKVSIIREGYHAILGNGHEDYEEIRLFSDFASASREYQNFTEALDKRKEFTPTLEIPLNIPFIEEFEKLRHELNDAVKTLERLGKK